MWLIFLIVVVLTLMVGIIIGVVIEHNSILAGLRAEGYELTYCPNRPTSQGRFKVRQIVYRELFVPGAQGQ